MGIKIQHKFPVTLLLSVIFFILIYQFSDYFPFTNNAFVVVNVRPVAANVRGYITNIYVKNEESVKKGQPLFTVFKKPYELHYRKTRSDVAEAKAQLIVFMKQVEKTQHLLQSQKELYDKFYFDYNHYKSALKDHAVSEIIVNTTLREKNSALSKFKALEKELELNRQQLIVQKMKIRSLIAIMENAKIDLDETTVYAKSNGAIQNMFLAIGTPIKIRKPIFSFVENDPVFIQANFNETDLRRVQAGNTVTIYPRIYFGTKVYHGVVFSRNWAASRLVNQHANRLQVVTNNENNWFLLPQRLPVQIHITDYDPIHYPLSVGSSVYVYVHTK